MSSDNHQQLTLVLGGANGKTGRRVAERLKARGVPMRIGSRSAEIPFDWEDQRTWAPALRDVSSVYLVFVPDLAVAGSTTAIQSFMDLAVASGVKRVVLLSGRGEEEAQLCEQIVQNAGLEWTVVRASWFAQNFSESFVRDMVMSGEVVLPAGQVAEPFVDADDIAEVAVAALSENGHSGQIYEVTGPRLLTFAEAVGEIVRATGRDIRYIPIARTISRPPWRAMACQPM